MVIASMIRKKANLMSLLFENIFKPMVKNTF